MNIIPLKLYGLLPVLLLIIFTGCNKNEKESDENEGLNTGQTRNAEVILSAETDKSIANPTQITAFEGGFILYDHALKQILFYSENGELINTFGREGKGPGEFQSVTKLKYDSGRIIASDSELLRLSEFDMHGNIISNEELASSFFAMDNAILSSKQFITPTNGQEDALAKFVNSENEVEIVFGEPVTETPEVADFNQWRKDFSSGKVPDFFRNRVAISGEESFFYLFLQTEGILNQYNTDGSLNWQKKFDLPEFRDAFGRFLERNRGNTSGNVYMLQYVWEMEQDEDGVYILINAPASYTPTLLFINHGGNKIEKMHFNGMDERPSGFSISPDKKWIWFLNVSAGIVYRSSFSTRKE